MRSLLLLFLFLSPTLVSPSKFRHRHLLNNDSFNVFSVIDHGALGDIVTDDTQAFKAAWRAACNSRKPATMIIPTGQTFLVNSVTFPGPCMSNDVTVEINGNIIAPVDPYQWKCGADCRSWIAFVYVDGLTIRGFGTIDGQGSLWWLRCRDEHHKHKQGCEKSPTVKRRKVKTRVLCSRGVIRDWDPCFFIDSKISPTTVGIASLLNHALVIGKCSNVHLRDLNFVNSPEMHIAFEESMKIYVTAISITAPKDSPNTDGIHIQGSQRVDIHNSRIGTGDDCISIGSGCSDININNIMCGPGHGISIGSLGKDGETARVEQVNVRDVKFIGTLNGARIKTWQGGNGYARNIAFERINFTNVVQPIVIDQYYCDEQYQCPNKTSAIHVSNVRYSQVFGTSNTKLALHLACSETMACTDILIENIDIRSTIKGVQTSSYCLNAYGSASGQVVPPVPCLAYSNG